jgi:hypothetical protein
MVSVNIQKCQPEQVSYYIAEKLDRESKKILWVDSAFHTGDDLITSIDNVVLAIFGANRYDIKASQRKTIALNLKTQLNLLKKAFEDNGAALPPFFSLGVPIAKESAAAWIYNSLANYMRSNGLSPLQIVYDDTTKVYSTREEGLQEKRSEEIDIVGTSRLDIADRLLKNHPFNKIVIDPHKCNHWEYTQRSEKVSSALPKYSQSDASSLFAALSFIDYHSSNTPTIIYSFLRFPDNLPAKLIGVNDIMYTDIHKPQDVIKRLLQ